MRQGGQQHHDMQTKVPAQKSTGNPKPRNLQYFIIIPTFLSPNNKVRFSRSLPAITVAHLSISFFPDLNFIFICWFLYIFSYVNLHVFISLYTSMVLDTNRGCYGYNPGELGLLVRVVSLLVS